jgi:hypothetical protein
MTLAREAGVLHEKKTDLDSASASNGFCRRPQSGSEPE